MRPLILDLEKVNAAIDAATMCKAVVTILTKRLLKTYRESGTSGSQSDLVGRHNYLMWAEKQKNEAETPAALPSV